jgi:hypothetical protein
MREFIPVHDAPDSLPQVGNVEVNDAVFDQKVDPVAGLQRLTAIDNREANLVFDVQTTQSELMQQAGAS